MIFRMANEDDINALIDIRILFLEHNYNELKEQVISKLRSN